MIWPWIMSYPTVDFGVWIACPFGAKLPYCPFGLVLIIEELDECICRISICPLRVGGGRTGGCNDFLDNGLVGRLSWRLLACTIIRYVAKVETCFWVSKSRSSHDLAE